MRVEHSWPDRGSVTIEVWQPSTFCAVSFPACFTSSLFLGRTSYPADEIGLGLQSPLPLSLQCLFARYTVAAIC